MEEAQQVAYGLWCCALPVLTPDMLWCLVMSVVQMQYYQRGTMLMSGTNIEYAGARLVRERKHDQEPFPWSAPYRSAVSPSAV